MAPQANTEDPNRSWVESQLIDLVVQQRMTLEEAAEFLRRIGVLDAVVRPVLQALQGEQQSNILLADSVVDKVSYSSDNQWYFPSLERKQWKSYLQRLEDMGSPDLGQLGEETRRITSLLADPKRAGQKRKGLVMGNVQSGKTRNFAGVMAKAVDAGYKLVIVLSGMHNNLREQTQARLDDQLFATDGWYPLTQTNMDIEPVVKPDALIRKQDYLCAVVKKNTHRLEHLVGILNEIPEPVRRVSPILIIDDEADQATPNSLAEKEQISKINDWLRQVWDLVVTGSYVAYTATPFANVLINPDDDDDLFPSDFLTTLQPGSGYFGAEQVFGITDPADDAEELESDGLDMVRTIPTADASLLTPPSNSEERARFHPALPASLREAAAWFVVATAIRWARGQREHSSMLVHTTHYTAPHFSLQKRVRALVSEWQSLASSGDLNVFLAAWQRESQRVAEFASEPMPDWGKVAKHIPTVVQSIETIVDNGCSPDRLNYGKDARTVIAVGGGTLSRGLTLEGLIVSYFTRTSNAYDTLLQMGRWFGYRQGYEDLPRVWVTKGLDRDYAFLARVERDLREEIESVQGSEFTPRQVGVKVRAHPGRLQVTADNKMYSAKLVQLGLSGIANQTFLLDGSPACTEENSAAAEALLDGTPLEPVAWSEHRYWAAGVDGSKVVRFLEQFRAHSDQTWLSKPNNNERLREWVRQWAPGSQWNVVIAANSKATAKDGSTPLGEMRIANRNVACLDRAPLKGSSEERLDFKAVMSGDDRIADIDPAVYGEEPHQTNTERRRLRRKYGQGQGLIVLYPISAQSKAGRSTRVNIPVRQHLLAFSIVFPSINASDGSEGTFVSVRKDWDVPLSVEGDEEESGDE